MTEEILAMVQGLNPYEEIDEKTNLIEVGLLDSLNLIMLAGILEDEYGIHIEDDEFDPDNFDTVQNVVAFVNKKMNRGNDG